MSRRVSAFHTWSFHIMAHHGTSSDSHGTHANARQRTHTASFASDGFVDATAVGLVARVRWVGRPGHDLALTDRETQILVPNIVERSGRFGSGRKRPVLSIP